MHKQYTADKILANGREYWPETNDVIECYAIFLHRSHELSLKKAVEVVQPYNLNISELDVLAALRNSAPPYVLTPTELQRSMLITSGGLTKLLYQLEARGFITRSVQEQDKRSKLVHLSETGREIIENSMEKLHQMDCELLDSIMTADEQDQLVQLLGKLTRALEQRDGHFTDE